MSLAQQPCRRRQVFELRIGLLPRNLVILARGEAAVGIEHQALRRQVFQRFFDAGGNYFGRFDFRKANIDAAQANSRSTGTSDSKLKTALAGDTKDAKTLMGCR